MEIVKYEYVRFSAFTGTEHDEVFLGSQSCQYGINFTLTQPIITQDEITKDFSTFYDIKSQLLQKFEQHTTEFIYSPNS
jgi:hypothetical protein